MIAVEPRHDRCISRTLAHKWSLDEVFITDFIAVSAQEMVLGAQVPRAHGFYCEFPTENRRPDLALIIEMCRQACFVVAHEQFGVPLEGNIYQFLFQELDARCTDDEAVFDTDRPVNLVIRSTVARVWKRGSNPSGMAWHFVVQAGVRRIAEVRIRMTWIDRAKWREMRTFMRRGRGLPDALPHHTAAPAGVVAPAEVGRVNPENVVLAEVEQDGDRFRAVPRIDIRHPVLFDHPIDHIYGMVQLEMCRQLAIVAGSRTHGVPAADLELAGFRTRFTSVAEFDLDTEVSAAFASEDPTGAGSRYGDRPDTVMDISIRQGDRSTSESTIRLRQRAKWAPATETS